MNDLHDIQRPADLGPTPAVRERWLARLALLDPRPGERVLDVGFGRGEALRWIAVRLGPAGRAVGLELRRVLRPGGRILVAHADYESQVYACSDRDLARRINLAFAVCQLDDRVAVGPASLDRHHPPYLGREAGLGQQAFEHQVDVVWPRCLVRLGSHAPNGTPRLAAALPSGRRAALQWPRGAPGPHRGPRGGRGQAAGQ